MYIKFANVYLTFQKDFEDGFSETDVIRHLRS